jgi:hypothetical protein
MSKPVLVIDPITGAECYTKHPEKLIARKRAEQESGRLRIVARETWVAAEGHPVYWNGDSGAYKMHIPGEVRS